MVHPVHVEQLLFKLSAFLPLVGAAAHCTSLRVDEHSTTNHTIWIGALGMGVHAERNVHPRGLHNSHALTGYRVVTVFSSASSVLGPVEVTHLATLNQADVLLKVAALLASLALSQLPEMPPELTGEETPSTGHPSWTALIQPDLLPEQEMRH